MLSEKTVEELARVSRLSLTHGEVLKYAEELTALEELVSVLQVHAGCDVKESGAVSLDALRKDEPSPCLVSKCLLEAAPVRSDGYIVVPRTVEEV